MQPRTEKLLADIARSAEFIARHVADLTLDAYERNDVLRLATERQFEIIGEALRRIALTDPAVAAEIPSLPRIVSFRNVLAHDYDDIDNRLVLEIVQTHVPALRQSIDRLLGSEDVTAS